MYRPQGVYIYITVGALVTVIAGEREKGSQKDIEHREQVREKLAGSKLLFCRSVSRVTISIKPSGIGP